MNNQQDSVFEMQISRTTHETRQIKLPFFCKTDLFAYKIYSKEKCVHVGYASTEKEIQTIGSSMAFLFSGRPEWKEITEDEFKNIYTTVSRYLSSLI